MKITTCFEYMYCFVFVVIPVFVCCPKFGIWSGFLVGLVYLAGYCQKYIMHCISVYLKEDKKVPNEQARTDKRT